MKIKPEHYSEIKRKIAALPQDQCRQHKENLRVKDLEKRFRWDCYHAAKCHNSDFYTYLNDNHIDTALKQIIKELGL